MRGERRFSCPVPPHGDASGYALAADGKELAFATMEKFDKAEQVGLCVCGDTLACNSSLHKITSRLSSTSPSQAWSTNVNIYTLVLEKDGTFGAPRCVTCENHGANTHPVYSPDGSKLAYLEMRTPTYEADKNRLMVVDRASGRKTDLTRDWDRSVDDFVWTEDSSTLIASVGEHGRTKIFTINASTGKQELLVGENSNTGLAVVPGTNLVAFGKNSLSYPTEYYTVDWHTGALAQRTSIHAAYMSSITTSPAEDFWFEGALGDQVMGWFVKPANFDPARKYPLAFLIHGGPQSAWMDSFSTRWNMQAFAGAGYAVAVVNFHGSNTYGQNFTDSINKEWGSHPFEDLMKVGSV